MKNMKALLALAVVATMTITPVLTVSAYEYDGPQGTSTGDDEATANGHTTFSVVEATSNENPSNVSFTVPLYVTMAVVGGSEKVTTPTNYEIRNTSQPADGAAVDAVGYSISVIGMTFEKLAGSSYNTVDKDAAASATDMELSIGGVYMPALSTPKALDIILSKETGSEFVTGDTFTKLAPNGVLDLPIIAKLGGAAVVADNTPAVAQFKVKYTVGAVVLDKDDNDMILSVYAGDDRIAAGLEKFEL